MLVRRRRRPVTGDAVVLMYHRVDDVERDPWRLAVPPERFAEQLEVLGGAFAPLPLRELVAGLAERRVPRRSVVVTFDDGYRDNLVNAKPLLEAHDVPATVFVTSGYVDSGRDFWWDELEDVCALAGRESRELWAGLQELGRAEREERLDELREEAEGGPRPRPSRRMTSAELLELASGELVDIGAHTVDHPRLPNLPPDRERHQLREAKRVLEELLGVPVPHFSYPHGEVARRTVREARAAGYASACTTVGAAVTPRSRPLRLPRLHVLDWSGEDFEERLHALLGG